MSGISASWVLRYSYYIYQQRSIARHERKTHNCCNCQESICLKNHRVALIGNAVLWFYMAVQFSRKRNSKKRENHKRNFSRFAAKLPAFTRYRVSVVLVRGHELQHGMVVCAFYHQGAKRLARLEEVHRMRQQ